eukprot:tig00021489_g21686.t1
MLARGCRGVAAGLRCPRAAPQRLLRALSSGPAAPPVPPTGPSIPPSVPPSSEPTSEQADRPQRRGRGVGSGAGRACALERAEGDLVQTREALERGAGELRERSPRSLRTAEALADLAMARLWSGEPDAAVDLCAEALEIARDAGADPAGLLLRLLHILDSSALHGPAAALEPVVLEVAQGRGAPWLVRAWLLLFLARAFERTGRPAEAARTYAVRTPPKEPARASRDAGAGAAGQAAKGVARWAFFAEAELSARVRRLAEEGARLAGRGTARASSWSALAAAADAGARARAQAVPTGFIGKAGGGLGGEAWETGTGWLYDRGRGLVVTCAHTLLARSDGAPRGPVRVYAGGARLGAELLGYCASLDVALLRVDPAALPECVEEAAVSTAPLEPGAAVASVGFPSLAAMPCCTAGAFWRPDPWLRREIGGGKLPFAWEGGEVLLHSAYSEAGFSGGPLLDGAGRVVGMNFGGAELPLSLQGAGWRLHVLRTELAAAPSLAHARRFFAWWGSEALRRSFCLPFATRADDIVRFVENVAAFRELEVEAGRGGPGAPLWGRDFGPWSYAWAEEAGPPGGQEEGPAEPEAQTEPGTQVPPGPSQSCALDRLY